MIEKESVAREKGKGSGKTEDEATGKA